MIRTIVYRGLNWGPLMLGNYQEPSHLISQELRNGSPQVLGFRVIGLNLKLIRFKSDILLLWIQGYATSQGLGLGSAMRFSVQAAF